MSPARRPPRSASRSGAGKTTERGRESVAGRTAEREPMSGAEGATQREPSTMPEREGPATTDAPGRAASGRGRVGRRARPTAGSP